MAARAARELSLRHPQQRLQSPSQGASALLHVRVSNPSDAHHNDLQKASQIAGLASFAYSFHWLTLDESPINEAFGWHWQHLTIIGLSLSTLTFLVGLAADLTSSGRLFALKNILSVVTAPLEVLISLLYWGLWTWDPKLVLPDWAPVLPFAADFSFHAVPAIALGIDLLFFSPPYTISVLPAFALSGAIAVGYWFWVEECKRHNGYYPYPIFDALDYSGRVALFVGTAAVMTVSTVSLKFVHGLLNGRAMDNATKPS